MDTNARKHYETRSRVIKALAHPTRLFILDKLAEGEHCVCQLQAMINADISTVSKHLSVLRQAGLIDYEKRGNQVFYCLLTPCIHQFIHCIDEVTQTPASH
ncbi:MAG: ArsR/SmtB family transcription factor [Candidatus Hydrogenedentota bacterium]